MTEPVPRAGPRPDLALKEAAALLGAALVVLAAGLTLGGAHALHLHVPGAMLGGYVPVAAGAVAAVSLAWVAASRVRTVRAVMAEREATEDELEESRTRFNLVAKATQDVVWDCDVQSGRLWWNENLEGVLGHRPADWARFERWVECIHPDDRERVMRRIEGFLDGSDESARWEYRLRHADGTFRDVADRAYVSRDGAGRALRIIGSIVDVTEHRAAERDLHASVAQFRALFEKSLDAMVLADDDMVYVDANPAACALLGLPRDAIVGKRIMDFTPDGGEDDVLAAWRTFIAAGEMSGDFRIVRADGVHRETNFAARANVRPGVHLSVMRDVTERRRSERMRDAFVRVARSLQRPRDARDAATEVLEETGRALECACVELWTVEDAGSLATLQSAWHADPGVTGDLEVAGRALPFARGVGLPGVAWESGEVTWAELTAAEDGFARAAEARRAGLARACAVPVVSDGVTSHVLLLFGGRDLVAGEPSTQFLVELSAAVGQFLARCRAEAARAESEARYRLLAENAHDMISKHGPGGVIEYVSPAVSRMLGHDPHALSGRSIMDLIHPEDRFTLRERYGDAMRAHEVGVDTYRLRRHDGSYVWVEATSRAVRTARQGDPMAFVVTTRDVTERRRAEEELRRREAFNRAVLRSLPSHTAVLDSRGRVQAVSESWQRFGRENGAPEDLALGIGVDYLAGCRASAEGRAAARSIERVLSGELPGFKTEYACHTPGAERWFAMYVAPLFGAGGGVVVSHVDVTERVRNEREREEARTAVARNERLAALGTLVAGVAHEVNNPLMYLAGSIELALLDVEDLQREAAEGRITTAVDIAATRHGLERALGGAARIGRITRSLRAVAREDAGDTAPVNLNDVVAGVCDLVRVGVPEGVDLTLQVAPEPLVVTGNASSLHQVVLNLVKNAVEAVGERGGTVRVAATSVRGEASVTVEDDGPGIPSTAMAQLFTPFFTTKAEGTGLGLPIVRNIVQAHGGAVRVEHARPTGARFTVRLPLRA